MLSAITFPSVCSKEYAVETLIFSTLDPYQMNYHLGAENCVLSNLPSGQRSNHRFTITVRLTLILFKYRIYPIVSHGLHCFLFSFCAAYF